MDSLKKMKEKESDVDKQRRLARLIAELEQDTGKVSDKDLERAKVVLRGLYGNTGKKDMEKDMKHGGKAHKKMKHGGKPHKDMKHGGKAHKEDMMYGGGAGMMKKKKPMMKHGGKAHKEDMMYGSMVTKKKKKNGMMGGGKVYTSMNKKYGGGIFPKKGNI